MSYGRHKHDMQAARGTYVPKGIPTKWSVTYYIYVGCVVRQDFMCLG